MPAGPGPKKDRPPAPPATDALDLDVPTPSAMPSEDAPVVVVVDDDADIRTMLVRALGTKYTVYEASDGAQAHELLQTIPVPHALVCDVMMPHLDGLGLAKMLRKDPALSRIPILFLTARGSPLDVVSGINAGARHYVTKPFKITDVLAKIAQMTAAKR